MMGDKSKIDWLEGGATWNVMVGCSHASTGCQNCFAESLAATRLAHLPQYAGLTKDGRWTGETRFNRDKLDQPMRWRKPRYVMVPSMGDLFHENNRFEDIAAVFGVMAACPQHTFIIVTKRLDVARRFYGWLWRFTAKVTSDIEVRVCLHYADQYIQRQHHVDYPSWPLPNVWLVATVENQEMADRRIPDLLACPAVVRGVSCEPLLGEINLHPWLCEHGSVDRPEQKLGNFCTPTNQNLQWCIVGGESGPNARPMHPDWARSLRDQCEAAGVAYFFKQWGTYKPAYYYDDDDHMRDAALDDDRHILMTSKGYQWRERFDGQPPPDTWIFNPVGKATAGHLLDGVEYRQMPGRSKG